MIFSTLYAIPLLHFFKFRLLSSIGFALAYIIECFPYSLLVEQYIFCSVELADDRILIFDTGPGMDGSDETSIVNWYGATSLMTFLGSSFYWTMLLYWIRICNLNGEMVI